MKFARYLQETQTPEWRRAYIDYRGLKKRIKAIARAQVDQIAATPSAILSTDAPCDEFSLGGCSDEEDFAPPSPMSLRLREAGVSFISFNTSLSSFQENDGASSRKSVQRFHEPQKTPDLLLSQGVGHFSPNAVMIADTPSPLHRARPLSPVSAVLPLRELLPLLSPVEMLFFDDLDKELSKVENFYLDREKEMKSRHTMLEDQLAELFEHQCVHAADQAMTSESRWTPALRYIQSRIRRKSRSPEKLVNHIQRKISFSKAMAGLESAEMTKMRRPKSFDDLSTKTGTNGLSQPVPMRSEDYLYAKRKLKKAVLEHYRALEILDNYRTLNLTGFRKALKKFEKVSKIPAQHAYIEERVEPSAFASSKTVAELIREMEDAFARRFKGGDKKRALASLRSTPKPSSHHCSMLRTGMLLGSTLPALVSGLWSVFQPDKRAAIRGWETLLFVYGVLFVPVLFTTLVGLNIVAWSRARINYVFIFGLNGRTRLDHRKYFETPALLLAGLCFAFWMSFSGIGGLGVDHANRWPLIWLGFLALVWLSPLQILSLPSRWWLLKNIGRLFLSGIRRVEFTDFWLGDQFCSMSFTLSNLALIVCAYNGDFEHGLERCRSSSRNWPFFFALSTLPLFIRVLQSLKRYAESKMIAHLINAGKYASGIISYLFYYLWRHAGEEKDGSLVLWCFFATVYTVYACSWDLVVDWSVLRPTAKHPLLREDLLYSDHTSIYYFSIISNILLRFAWVFYIPFLGLSSSNARTDLWSFILGMLEMLRRWQWNFYRLESEQLGNTDQYQVTREVSLPYQLDNTWYEEDKDDSS